MAGKSKQYNFATWTLEGLRNFKSSGKYENLTPTQKELFNAAWVRRKEEPVEEEPVPATRAQSVAPDAVQQDLANINKNMADDDNAAQAAMTQQSQTKQSQPRQSQPRQQSTNLDNSYSHLHGQLQNTRSLAARATAGPDFQHAANLAGSLYEDIKQLSDEAPKGSEVKKKLGGLRLATSSLIRQIAARVSSLRQGGDLGPKIGGQHWGKFTETKYVPSGNPQNIERFGKSEGSATAKQIANRAEAGFTGRGRYDGIPEEMRGVEMGDFDEWEGNGGFFGGLIGKVGDAVTGGRWDLENRVSDAENSALNYARDQDWFRKAAEFVPAKYRPQAQIGAEAIHGLVPSYTGSGAYYGEDDMDPRKRHRAGDYYSEEVPRRLQAEYKYGQLDDPTMKTNMIVNPGMAAPGAWSRRPPSVESMNTPEGEIRLRHQEYLTDVTATSGDFTTVLKLALNAGMSDSFPTLSKFAKLYQEYSFKQLIIKYRSLVTEGNASAGGSVMIATVYNPDQQAYSNKRQIENAEYSASGKVTDLIIAGVECDARKNAVSGTLYTRTGPVAHDLHTYDMGFVQIATQGATPGQTIGEIWVEYDVMLSKLGNTFTVDPLKVGEGVNFTACAANQELQQMSLGVFGKAYGMTGPERYPLNTWEQSTAVTTSGQGVQEPGYYSYLVDLAQAAGYPAAPTSFMSHIESWSQSPGIDLLISTPDNPAVTGQNLGRRRLTLQFSAASGSTYLFKMFFNLALAISTIGGQVLEYDGLNNQINNAGGLLADPTPLWIAQGTVGTHLTTTVQKGFIRCEHQKLSSQHNFGYAQASNPREWGGLLVHTAVVLTVAKSAPQSQCEVQFDFDPSSFDSVNQRCCAMGYSFNRIE